MTEMLSRRLHAEAAEIEVPPAPTAAVLAYGKRRRRRRRTLSVAGAAAVTAAAVAVVSAAVPSDPDRARGLEPANDATSESLYQEVGAFAAGSTVYVGSASAEVDGKITGIYDTSIGAVVKTGSTYTVVNADGESREVATIKDVVVGTDPSQPYLAYTEPDGAGFAMVVLDVSDGSEVARARVDRPFTWGGWNGPPSVLAGGLMWSHFDDGWVELDLGSGDVRLLPDTSSGVFEMAGGVYAVQQRHEWVVRRVDDGTVVRRFDATADTYAFLSPNGQFLKFWDQMSEDGRPWSITDVATGRAVDLPRDVAPWDVQWSPDGNITYLDPASRSVSSCDPLSGTCTSVEMSFLPGEIWRSGSTAEG